VNTKAPIWMSGYCMGGPYTMLISAAVPGRVGAASSFHGGNLVTDKLDSPHLLASKIMATYYFAIATNDDQRQPDAKDKIREAFDAAHHPVRIEVYEGCNHGWCVSDGMVYNKAGADRAWGELCAPRVQEGMDLPDFCSCDILPGWSKTQMAAPGTRRHRSNTRHGARRRTIDA
jgi:carboxymethylenebutenolidase